MIYAFYALILTVFVSAHKQFASKTNSVVQFVDLGNHNTTFDFNYVIKENEKMSTYSDKCPLRIVGGIEAPITAVPYQIALRRGTFRNNNVWYNTFCGGALVTLKYVLTVTHCFNNAGFYKWKSVVRAVAGTTITYGYWFVLQDEHSRRIKHFFVHQEYNTVTHENDISVLELENAFIESRSIKPIRMHVPSMSLDVGEGVDCLVSGFGLQEKDKMSKFLRMVCVPTISAKQCAFYFPNIQPSVICAGVETKDSCQGDSGGPLVCRGVLVGLVSFGGICGVHPGVYTRVSSFTSGNPVPFVAKHAARLRSSHVFPYCNVFVWILMLIIM